MSALHKKAGKDTTTRADDKQSQFTGFLRHGRIPVSCLSGVNSRHDNNASWRLETAEAVCGPSGSSEPVAVLGGTGGLRAGTIDSGLWCLATDQNLGHLERQAAQDVQGHFTKASNAELRPKRKRPPPVCPLCAQKLTRLSAGHARTFETRLLVPSRFSALAAIANAVANGAYRPMRPWAWKRRRAIRRRCRTWPRSWPAKCRSRKPARSPEHLTGVKLPRATLDQEARRQGERATKLRSQLDQMATAQKRQLELTLEPYQMVIQTGCLEHPGTGWLGPEPQRSAGQGKEPGTLALGLYRHVLSLGSSRPDGWRTASNYRTGFCGHAPQASTACVNSYMPKRCAADWARRPAPWSSLTVPCGSGG